MDPAAADGAAEEAVAELAGLRYVSDAEPGLRRLRSGRGFRYVDPRGRTVRDPRVRARIARLAVPPAWTDVWICRDPRGHLQATGRDARGRKQYRYHPEWRGIRDAHKFDRLVEVGRRLPDLRARVVDDLRRPGMGHDRVVALVVRLLDHTLIRVGNEEYAVANETYGLTTLRADHVTVRGRRVRFDFVGKGGVEHELTVADERLAKIVHRCHQLGGKQLFTYRDASGEVVPVGSDDVNTYLREVLGAGSSAKDFRTWGATVLVAEHLLDAGGDEPEPERTAADQQILAAIDHAAEALGNTRAVCRASYLHPAIPEAYRSGELVDAWRRARAGGRFRRSERTVLSLLERSGTLEERLAG